MIFLDDAPVMWTLVATASLGGLVALLQVVSAYRESRAVRCSACVCGYSLVESPDRCPECGLDADQQLAGQRRRSRRRKYIFAGSLLVGVVATIGWGFSRGVGVGHISTSALFRIAQFYSEKSPIYQQLFARIDAGRQSPELMSEARQFVELSSQGGKSAGRKRIAVKVYEAMFNELGPRTDWLEGLFNRDDDVNLESWLQLVQRWGCWSDVNTIRVRALVETTSGEIQHQAIMYLQGHGWLAGAMVPTIIALETSTLDFWVKEYCFRARLGLVKSKEKALRVYELMRSGKRAELTILLGELADDDERWAIGLIMSDPVVRSHLRDPTAASDYERVVRSVNHIIENTGPLWSEPMRRLRETLAEKPASR